MTFFINPYDNPDPLNIASVIGPVFQDPHITTFDQAIAVRFDRLISVQSLMNATITLQTNEATPKVVQGAFAPVNPANYNSLSRILELFFLAGVQPGTNYTLVITGVTDPVGNVLGPYTWNFQTNASTVMTEPPVQDPVYIEDHSIKGDAFTDFNAIIQANPGFYISSTTPDNKEDVVVPISYNDGVISVTFSTAPDPAYINFNYFKFQYKPISRGMNPWQTVPNAVIGVQGNTVNISVPSQSATPVISIPSAPTPPVFNYYNNSLGNYGQAYVGAPYPTDIYYGYGSPDLMFFLDGYKYRLKVPASVGYTDSRGIFNPLGTDQYVQFLVDPQPMVLSPDEFTPFYPDASLYEIAELVAQYSQEAQNLLKYVLTDTLAHLMDDDSIIAQTVQDFVQASTLCSLSRVYDIAQGAQQTEIALGDLRVAMNNGTSLTYGTIGRVNATTWCQLAATIRDELYDLSRKGGMKSVVKAQNRHNPMPDRHLRHAEWRDWSVYDRPGH